MFKYNMVLFLLIFSSKIFSQEGGYLNNISVARGDTIKFHISTSVNMYQIKIFKIGVNDQLVYTSPDLNGIQYPLPDSAYSKGCDWPVTYQMQIPPDWESGVYRADFQVNSGYGSLVFVVREQTLGSNSKNLIILNTNTWNAYNNFGGKSLYEYNSSNGERAYKVTYNRPFTQLAQGDFYNWTYKFNKWMLQNNLNAEFGINTDLDNNPNFLNNYSVVLIVGHDEYWSYEERSQIQSFLNRGGRLLLLGGNTCWWQVRIEDNNRTIVCYKDASLDPLNGIADSISNC